MITNGYRRDIDGLRGIAILAVIGFHYFPSVLRGGFIGVDVFFVISGFLITDIIYRECREEMFSFRRFYERRIRRIFPALIITLVAAMGLGYIVLLPHEYVALNKFIIAGGTFTTNILLLVNGNSGYFNEGGVGRQLIHLWSLSIEEQFYIVWPPLIYVLYKHHRLHWLTGLLAMFIFVDISHISDTYFDRYYFPGTRFWEPLAGSLLALTRNAPGLMKLNWLCRFLPNNRSGKKILSNSAVILLALSAVVIRPTSQWPGWIALGPILATAILVAGADLQSLAYRVLVSPVLVFFGLISYPLYLYHWLFVSFYMPMFGETLSIGYSVAAILTSVLASYLTYRWVEIPIRQRNIPSIDYRLLPMMLATVCLVSVHILNRDGFPERYDDAISYNDIPKTLNYQMQDAECLTHFSHLFKPELNKARDFCRLHTGSGEGSIVVVGDSHASKLYQGFAELGAGNVVHLGRGSCPPIMGLSPLDPWYKCQPMLDSLIEYALDSDFTLVILTGVFERYFDHTYETGLKDADMEMIIGRFFERLGKSKKSILIVLDNPKLPFNPSICLKRKVDWNQSIDCSFDRKLHDSRTHVYKTLFYKYSKDYVNIKLLDTTKYFCNEQRCSAINDYGLLYTGDDNHLSQRGSELIVKAIIEQYPELFHSGSVRR